MTRRLTAGWFSWEQSDEAIPVMRCAHDYPKFARQQSAGSVPGTCDRDNRGMLDACSRSRASVAGENDALTCAHLKLAFEGLASTINGNSYRHSGPPKAVPSGGLTYEYQEDQVPTGWYQLAEGTESPC
jgi:hypothetical protein